MFTFTIGFLISEKVNNAFRKVFGKFALADTVPAFAAFGGDQMRAGVVLAKDFTTGYIIGNNPL
jgi:hypothetical protein